MVAEHQSIGALFLNLHNRCKCIVVVSHAKSQLRFHVKRDFKLPGPKFVLPIIGGIVEMVGVICCVLVHGRQSNMLYPP